MPVKKNSTKVNSKHFFLAVLTVFIWGMNFIAIHSALEVFPPFLLCAVRFGLAAIPFVFFFPRPKAPFKLILGYGVFTFAAQFALLFSGMQLGLSPGLASLVLQVQVFFSMGLAAAVFQDRPGKWKIFGAMISFIGVAIVASHVNAGTSLTGLILVLLSALSWAAGNMFTKKVAAQSSLALVSWGSLVAFPLMAVFSLLVEGPEVIAASFNGISWETIGATSYIVYLSTIVGYGVWGFLLKSYPTAQVVPFTLLVPVFGLLSSAVVLGEELSYWKLVACLFIMLGLVVSLLEKQIVQVISRISFLKRQPFLHRD